LQSLSKNIGKISKNRHSKIGKKADRMINQFQKEAPVLPTDIPLDPALFYKDFGLLRHPNTGKIVKDLTAYQYELWENGHRYNYRLVVKSQKTGITTSVLIEDFQKAITTCAGKEILIIAQSNDHAKEHIYTLRKMIKASKKYRDFLIDKPTDILLRDEVTKVMTIYLHNPKDPFRPTRIIGLGPNPASIWSWKEVAHIHMSDIVVVTTVDDSEIFGAAFSRLANTRGSMVIETPPRKPSGKVFEIYEASELKKEDKKSREAVESQFKIMKIPAAWAVEAGLITKEFLEGERVRLGPMYGMYYECEFYNSASTWYKPEYFHYTKDNEMID